MPTLRTLVHTARRIPQARLERKALTPPHRARERETSVNIEIPQHIQDLMEEVWPDTTNRVRGNKARDILYRVLKREADERRAATGPGPFINTKPGIGNNHVDVSNARVKSSPREITDFIADNAPAIDNTNWSLIKNGVAQAQEAGAWDATALGRLLDDLNEPFEGVRNERACQNSRITAFFDRLLA